MLNNVSIYAILVVQQIDVNTTSSSDSIYAILQINTMYFFIIKERYKYVIYIKIGKKSEKEKLP